MIESTLSFQQRYSTIGYNLENLQKLYNDMLNCDSLSDEDNKILNIINNRISLISKDCKDVERVTISYHTLPSYIPEMIPLSSVMNISEDYDSTEPLCSPVIWILLFMITITLIFALLYITAQVLILV